MLINTSDGWRALQNGKRPAPRPGNRSMAVKMAEELADLCPTLGDIGAQIAASRMNRDLMARFGASSDWTRGSDVRFKFGQPTVICGWEA